MKLKWSPSIGSIAVIMLILTLISSNLNWGKEYWKGIIEADAKGYYAYLPAVFIYDDLNFSFFHEIEEVKYYDQNLFYDYRSGAEGKIINKYYCGTAVATSPFFLVAHGITKMSGGEADGYSKLYPIFINLAALFYLLAGLVYLRLILGQFAIKEWQKAIVLVAAVFGTNLFYYAVVEPGLSHIYSFTFVTMFFYYAKRYFSTFKQRDIVILGLLLGMIVLIRPINGLVIFSIPFFAGSYAVLKDGIGIALKKFWPILIGSVAAISIVFIQLVIYKLSTGSYLVYSYSEEGFNFLSPHIFDILFSYRKGLFLYTPLLLVSCMGLYFAWKSSRFQFFSWVLFFLLITYVFASWWMWYYGGSFSSRVYVEYISFFMILLAFSLKGIQHKVRYRIVVSTIFALIVVCQIQTFQYRYFQIHWSDMTKEKYWEVFLRVDRLM